MSVLEPDVDEEIRRLQLERQKMAEQKGENVALGKAVSMDKDIYGSGDKSQYHTSLPADDEDEDMDGGGVASRASSSSTSSRRAPLRSYTAPKSLLQDIPQSEDGANEIDPFEAARKESKRPAEREDEYRARARKRMVEMTPARADPFAEATGASSVASATAAVAAVASSSSRSYKDVMQEAQLEREQEAFRRAMKDKETKQARSSLQDRSNSSAAAMAAVGDSSTKKRRRRWDQAGGADDAAAAASSSAATQLVGESKAPVAAPGAAVKSEWDEDDANLPRASKKPRSRWDDATPAGPSAGVAAASGKRSRWDATPDVVGGAASLAGATPQGKVGSWDQTPVGGGLGIAATPLLGVGVAATPAHYAAMTPDQLQAARWEREIDIRNRPLSDAEIDEMLPKEGYKIVMPPADYVPVRTQASKLTATPTPMTASGFAIQGHTEFTLAGMGGANAGSMADDLLGPVQPAEEGLPEIKPEDRPFFEKILQEADDDELTPEEDRERQIMKLLLKIKNGTPQMRKQALRVVTDKARFFGPSALFNQILPLLMSPALEDQERHLLVKVIDRVLYKLDDLVRPYVHKILVVIQPLLIDEDYYARVEGREIISNLAKAAGLATMIATMRPDIDNPDEYVRNTTARAFSVVASALGIPAMLPFLKAVCNSKKSWEARHTGIKIVQQIAILMGCAVLPHLRSLVEIVHAGLNDEQQKVRTITALAVAALAEAATPYGIESFDPVLKPLWYGIRQHRGKGLAAFLKAIGFIIPLMDAEHASYYTKEVMLILIREFASPDEEMKKIVLKVVKQCVATDGVEAAYIRESIMPDFFRHFWVRRMALDRRNAEQLVETTLEIASKCGAAEILGRLASDLRDENEPFRKMVVEAVDQIISDMGAADIDSKLESQLVDGVLYAFQEQSIDQDAAALLSGFGTVITALGMRAKPYLPQICGTIKWRLNNRSAKVRQQAADLVSRIAAVMHQCHEEQLMGHLGVVLYEYLGEEYPDVLASILRALRAIVSVIGMTKMTPPIKDLLPRLTPILNNRHERVQENVVDLVGRIADRAPEMVSAREWMRICFALLEMLKAHKKGIRRAAVNTFGYIAKAIGPPDVLATLLNNLKVQERQMRVCTTVAIAIVAETCSPFTVLPALMNEYRVPELNVQNGVLKALSFMFEYIGEMGKDYMYAVTPLLEDALVDRDWTHRQTACTVVKHMSLGVVGLGCEDALQHLLNLVWPNVFETSPHVMNAVTEAIDGLRCALGPTKVLQYLLQGLYHPARKVRQRYWSLFNNLYIASQDAAIAAYPRYHEQRDAALRRTELEIFI